MTDVKQQGDLYIIDDANNTLTVDSANTRVGIGNNNPGHALSVTGDGNFTANLSAGSNLFLVDAGNSRITLGTTTAVSGNVLTVSGASNFSDTITAAGTGNSLTVSDTLRIAQTGSGLRMTNVGAFDNDGSNNFRVFGTNDLILAANGNTGTALTIDATNQDVTISNDLRVGTGAFYINSTQLTATATELNQLDGVTLGTAASANTGDFATAAQGALANTALQVVAVDGVTITGDGTVGNPLVAAGGGGGGISIGDAVGSGTAGSVLFVDASTNLAQDNSNLFFDDSNNRLGIGTNSPSHTLHVRNQTASGSAPIARFESDEGNILFNRYAGIMIQNNEPSGGDPIEANRWQIQQRDGNNTDPPNGPFDISYGDGSAGFVGAGDTILRITSGGNVGVGLGNTDPSTKLHVSGTIRQTNSTNAVLVSDGNGDIGSASNLQDIAYSDGLYVDGSGMYPLVPPAPSAWGGAPPATLNEAIDRLAAALYNSSGPIP